MIFEKVINRRLYENCQIVVETENAETEAGRQVLGQHMTDVVNVNLVVFGDAPRNYIQTHHPNRTWLFYKDFQLKTGRLNMFVDFLTTGNEDPFGVHLRVIQKPNGLDFGPKKAAYHASCMIYQKDELVSIVGVFLDGAGRIVSKNDDAIHPMALHTVIRAGSSLTVAEAHQRADESVRLLIPAFFALTFFNCRKPKMWATSVPANLTQWQKQHRPIHHSLESSFVALNVMDNDGKQDPFEPIPVGWFEFGKQPAWVAGRAAPRHESRIGLMEDAQARAN